MKVGSGAAAVISTALHAIVLLSVNRVTHSPIVESDWIIVDTVSNGGKGSRRVQHTGSQTHPSGGSHASGGEVRNLAMGDLVLWGNVPPRYPRVAERFGWQGKVSLRLSFDDEGAVERAEVLASSGYEVLDSEALRAAKEWKIPMELLPKLSGHQVLVPIEFIYRS